MFGAGAIYKGTGKQAFPQPLFSLNHFLAGLDMLGQSAGASGLTGAGQLGSLRHTRDTGWLQLPPSCRSYNTKTGSPAKWEQ